MLHRQEKQLKRNEEIKLAKSADTQLRIISKRKSTAI
jgi:hypothetical protein